MASKHPEQEPQRESGFFAELRKRKVVQAAAIYGAVAWGVTEVVVTIVEQLFLPQWVSTLAVIFFVVGFPVAMFLAWTFDITSEGIRRTDIKSKRGTASIFASLVLLIAGTAGLFFLIKPSLDIREDGQAAAVGVEPNSLAVMPFVNASARPEDAYLADGLGDELRDQLARVSGLSIAARSSSVAAVEQGMDATTAAERLGVAHLVEGSLRRQGNILTVSVHLIDGRKGLARWSQQFQRGPQELLNVQQAIAEAVVANVLPDVEAAVAEPSTRNPTANEYMLQARHLEQQVRDRADVDSATLLEAVRLYRKATEADPTSALAFSRLAGALMYLGDLEAAEAPIFKALSLAPGLSEVQNTLGEFHWARGLKSEAGNAWARAIEIDPNNPDALSNFGTWYWFELAEEGVIEPFRRALELDPLSLERHAALGSISALEGHSNEAREVIANIEQSFVGAAAFRVIAELYDFLGEVDNSIAWTIRARDLEPDDPGHVQKLAEYYADIGDSETAVRLDPNGIGVLFKLRMFAEMIDVAEFAMIDEPGSLRIRSLLATAYNAIGEHESAIYVLKDTGLPDLVLDGWRNTIEMDGFHALQDALYATGESELSHQLAHFKIYEMGYTEGDDWWLTINQACERAMLGEDDEARRSLERAQQGPRLPWDPILKDRPCFERFSDDPVYIETVRYFDGLRADLRQRLPDTLAEFGVEL